MTFKEATDYLFTQYPAFTNVGASAYKPGLENIKKLCKLLGNPQKKFKSIHIAGTNGKGSTSHILATILQLSGYKTGLFTSPHLKSFTERIRVNGVDIPEAKVIEFLILYKSDLEVIKPSFFEITTALAFQYFAVQNVEIAVIETGLGGRLDSTNILNPILCVITNIGWDHMDLLGNTLEKIAIEKAGIIKKNTPIVISENQKEIEHVFIEKAKNENAPLYWSDEYTIHFKTYLPNGQRIDIYKNQELIGKEIVCALAGKYQLKNLKGILKAAEIAKKECGLTKINFQNTIKSLLEVKNYNILKGRWQLLKYKPLLVVDTGHNFDGIKEIISQIESYKYFQLWMILGMVKDKDHQKILEILPKRAKYIFCEPQSHRKLDAEKLLEMAKTNGIDGIVIKNVNEAIKHALNKAETSDFIFVGGSNFVVAEINDL